MEPDTFRVDADVQRRAARTPHLSGNDSPPAIYFAHRDTERHVAVAESIPQPSGRCISDRLHERRIHRIDPTRDLTAGRQRVLPREVVSVLRHGIDEYADRASVRASDFL